MVAVSHITIQWGLLPCEEQNGDIIGYKVTWGRNTLNLSGAKTFHVTVMDLSASVTYSFKVAAVNTVGTGTLRTVTATTLGSSVIHFILC